jgi:hypothetical protein
MPWQLEQEVTYEGGAVPAAVVSHEAVVRGPPTPAPPVVGVMTSPTPAAPLGCATEPVPAAPEGSDVPAVPDWVGGVPFGLRVVPSLHPTTAAIPQTLAAIATARTANRTRGTRLELMSLPPLLKSARTVTARGFANHQRVTHGLCDRVNCSRKSSNARVNVRNPQEGPLCAQRRDIPFARNACTRAQGNATRRSLSRFSRGY